MNWVSIKSIKSIKRISWLVLQRFVKKGGIQMNQLGLKYWIELN